MDIEKYKDEFITEAREYLDTLNDSLLILEKDPKDEMNINRIFRAFHTLKGNAATMGFMRLSEVAHALEDILAKVRDGKLTVTEDIMNHLFNGCDTIEKELEVIQSDNFDTIQVDDIVKSLKSVLDTDETAEKNQKIEVGEKAVFSAEEAKKLDELKDKNIIRSILIFDKNNQLKTAKAKVVMRNLAEIGTIIKTNPQLELLKDVRFDNEVEIIVATDKKKEDIQKIINHVSGIKEVFILSLDQKYEKPKSLEHEEKELSKAAIANKHQQDVVRQIQSVRVDMGKLDKLMNLVGELLINNIRLQDINRHKEWDNLKTVLTGIDRLILELQDEITEVRMIPIGNIFKRFPRMVRDLANKEKKKVKFEMEGSEIKFDRGVLDQIGDPIVHLLRNSVDHGIETAEERINKGKTEEGTIKLIARREKNNAVIEVTDDGIGIDPVKVTKTCIKKGVITQEQANNMNTKEQQMLIFKAGVSTNEVVTDVSGRGVGMDVVLNTINELGGTLNMNSEINKGTAVTMQLPLTVAIITALLVKINDEKYAIPLTSVDKTVDIKPSQIKTIQGHEVFILRGTEIPIFWLHKLLGHEQIKEKKNLTIVIVNKEGQRIGLVVDTILKQQQILIKGLANMIKGTKGCAGATILGDGGVILILDINTLL